MMIRFFFAMILLSGLWACNPKSNVEDSTEAIPQKKIKIFLLAGQSNMDGRARAYKLSADDLARLEKAKKNILLFYNHNKPVPLQTTSGSDFVQKKFDAKEFFGPELFFGINLAEAFPADSFIFIKRSRGGMSLYGAWNPEWTLEKATLMGEENQPHLYKDLIQYTDSILSGMDTSQYELCAVLWVQGETDANTKKYGNAPADTYEDNLRKLIAGLRTEFHTPELPFIIFQVGGGKVVEGMKNIAASDEFVSLIPQVRDTSSAYYFERNPPPIGHYTYKSMKKIGRFFFEYFDKNYAKNCNK